MIIGGYQKISFIDYPDVISSVIFTRGCNFGCSYCHNYELFDLNGDSLKEEDVFLMIEQNKNMIDGVVVSGGEPCLQPDILFFLSKLKKQKLKIKLDTNGSNPEVLSSVLSDELADYVALDIKSSWENYSKITSFSEAADKVKKSVLLLHNSSLNYEFRTTIFPGVHAMRDFISIAGYLKKGNRYFIQDIKYEKTFKKDIIPQNIFAKDVAKELSGKFPDLIIGCR